MRSVRCLHCHALILGVEVLPDYPDVLVLYAHKLCHSERRCVDPNATWRMLCDALKVLAVNLPDTEARERAIELLEVLATWLRKGGFPPADIAV